MDYRTSFLLVLLGSLAVFTPSCAGGSGDDDPKGDGDAAGDGDTTGDGDTAGDGDGDQSTGGSFNDEQCPPCAAPPDPTCVGTGVCGCGPYNCPGDGDVAGDGDGDVVGDGDVAGDGDGDGDGDVVGDGDGVGDGDIIGDGDIMMCPPCAAPPGPNCVGTGICGCGPYICPEEECGDLTCAEGEFCCNAELSICSAQFEVCTN